MTAAATSAAGNAISRYAIRMCKGMPRILDTRSVPMIAKKRMTEKLSSVPINVRSATRNGMPYQCGGRDAVAVVTTLSPALVEDREFEAGIGWE